eukprot:1146868-Pelagomonas_calceolata.AAC.2
MHKHQHNSTAKLGSPKLLACLLGTPSNLQTGHRDCLLIMRVISCTRPCGSQSLFFSSLSDCSDRGDLNF